MARWWRQMFWIAPLLAAIGFFSYYLFFAQYPALRDFPWLNLPLLILAVALSLLGTAKTWFVSRPWRKIANGLAFSFSGSLLALFVFYVFILSYQMPEGKGLAAVEKLPEVSLVNASGEATSPIPPKGKKALITFIRGYW